MWVGPWIYRSQKFDLANARTFLTLWARACSSLAFFTRSCRSLISFSSLLRSYLRLCSMILLAWQSETYVCIKKTPLNQLSKHKQRGRGTGNSLKGHLFFLMALYLRLDLLQQSTSRLIVVQFTGCGEVLGCLLPVTQQPREAGRHTTSLSEDKGLHYKHQPFIWAFLQWDNVQSMCIYTDVIIWILPIVCFMFCQVRNPYLTTKCTWTSQRISWFGYIPSGGPDHNENRWKST